MDNLPFDQAAQRFQENEQRLNVFINAPDAEKTYLTVNGEAVPTLPFLLPAVQAASASAAADATRAAAAADAAWLNGGIHDTVTEGLAAAAEGDYFAVPTDAAATYLTLYRKTAGAAQAVKDYPSAAVIENARIGMASIATDMVRTQTLMVERNGFE